MSKSGKHDGKQKSMLSCQSQKCVLKWFRSMCVHLKHIFDKFLRACFPSAVVHWNKCVFREFRFLISWCWVPPHWFILLACNTIMRESLHTLNGTLSFLAVNWKSCPMFLEKNCSRSEFCRGRSCYECLLIKICYIWETTKFDMSCQRFDCFCWCWVRFHCSIFHVRYWTHLHVWFN